MPVVDVDLSRLQGMLGRTSRKRILEALPFLGLDIESESGNNIRVEYSPNRPDYSTDYGIALGLEGLLEIHTGSVSITASDSGYRMAVDRSVSKTRPTIMAACALGRRLDDRMIRQLVAMQEDLHFGLGRGRKKSSIGIHDLDRISFPILYTTIPRSYRFVPLGGTEPATVRQILSDTEQGRSYGHLLARTGRVPAILDSTKKLISLPPIINSDATSVAAGARNLLVEVTGLDASDVAGALSVMSTILQRAGFTIHPVRIPGSKNPVFADRKMSLDPKLPGTVLGLDLTPSDIVACLGRARITASAGRASIRCLVPSYRFDILGPMDLVEEVALGYGIGRMTPKLSPPRTVGNAGSMTATADAVDATMIGLGYAEALNSCLSGIDVLYNNINKSPGKIISVLDSKSREHVVLRDSLIPGLLDCFSRNIHHAYPQRLYETGTVFGPADPIDEHAHFAAMSAHPDACFSEIKSVLQEVCKTALGLDIRTVPADHLPYEPGACADILAGNRMLGKIGQADPAILRGLRIRVPVAGFEIMLD